MARIKDPQRRALIMENALSLFAKRGFHAVSVKDLAEHCGISLGSLYTYFESKEQLGNELFRHWKMVFAEAASVGTETARGREAHRRMWTNIGEFIAANPQAFSFLESQLHATYLDAESSALEMALTQSAVQYYVDRLELGLCKEKAQLIISATFGVYIQVLKAAQAGLLSLDLDARTNLEKLSWAMASQP
jgi:AcrR family transcriptional regulator